MSFSEASLWMVLYSAGGVYLRRQVERFLRRQDMLCANYRNHPVPIGMGLYIFLMLSIYFVLTQFTIWSIFRTLSFYGYFFTAFIVFVFGWFDDREGDHMVKGIRGHVRFWRKSGFLTSGLLKALAVGTVSVWFVFMKGDPFPLMAMQLLLLPLLTNSMNLTDLRPGRALKVFLLLSAVVLIFNTSKTGWFYMFPVILSAVLLLPGDLRAKYMLGDAGSNLLGFVLAVHCILFCPWWLQFIYFCMAVGMHWYAEKKSITAFIERTVWLRWLDEWGRSH